MSQIAEKLVLFGLPVHIFENYLQWLHQRLRQQQGTHVVTLNAEMAMQARENEALNQIIHQADLVIPDGAGVVFYFFLHGHKIRRSPGIELAESLLRGVGSTDQSYPVFFFGGKPGVAQTAARKWQQQFPQLAIAGVAHGYISPEEETELQRTLQQQQPRIIFVGLGVPRQEFWIAKHRHLCPDALWVGVGGSFDIWAGEKARAPLWLQKLQMEWAYRLYQEPWRWRRMLVLPQFAWVATLAAMRGTARN
jgi:N-acetylglucosaminyldiphosphoundecaprenol N-acetyl-beta-D-mannosaminyltransferase